MRAHEGAGEEERALRHWIRPDGRCFVFGELDGDLPRGRLYATANEGEEARLRALLRLGFTPHRRELVLEVPTDRARWGVLSVESPAGISFVQADEVDESDLRLLDDLLRQDVPGTDGWKWGVDGFREETYDTPAFDPATYLVAVDEDGDSVGLVRVWMRSGKPDLGLVGVRSEWRRRGVARALVAGALAAVQQRGRSAVRASVDETNTASRQLLLGFGGEPVGLSFELRREPLRNSAFRLRPAVPGDAEMIADIQVRSFQVGLVDAHPLPELLSATPASRIPLWREREALVAEDAGGVVGVIQHGPSDQERAGEIYRLFVAPECWGTGVAQALMLRAREQLGAEGFEMALLWVHAENPRARRFYESDGWRFDGTEKQQESTDGPVTLLRYRTHLC